MPGANYFFGKGLHFLEMEPYLTGLVIVAHATHLFGEKSMINFRY